MTLPELEALAEASQSRVYVRAIGADLVRRYGADWLRGLG